MTIDYREAQSNLVQKVNQRHNDSIDQMKRRLAKRDNLYWNFRYRKGSYKARKMGLQPILMMAKRGLDKIRIYGEVGEAIEPAKLRFATIRFKAWGQKERDIKRTLMPAYKQWLKTQRLTAKDNPYSYWLINIFCPQCQ